MSPTRPPAASHSTVSTFLWASVKEEVGSGGGVQPGGGHWAGALGGGRPNPGLSTGGCAAGPWAPQFLAFLDTTGGSVGLGLLMRGAVIYLGYHLPNA